MENRDVSRLFDLTFKKLLRVSKKALLSLINAQFHTSYPLNTPVEYLNTEHITKHLKSLLSDSLILIGGKHLYHFEAEIRNNPDMALRMFIYGFEIGREHRETKPGTGRIVIRFPQAKVFYWEPNANTPDRLSLTLVFPDGKPHRYTVETYKPLEHSVTELEEQHLVLLLPFHILKYRKAVKKARDGEERRRLAGEMGELMKTLVEATKGGVREGILTGTERKDILDLMGQLQTGAYEGYTEM
jgi:hypothetical protein